MNRANQHLLFQATNQGFLGIRQSEINYYQGLNVAFGTQAALVGGFTYGVFSQNQINYDNNYPNVDILADVYWICSAITIAMAVHVILCTMLLQELGPGLALNGPIGSMARATEGMRIEQKQIIFTFISMMIMFSVSTVLSCWVVMTFEAALGCTAAFAVAACIWYYYCERIYLRFYWEDEDLGWRARGNSGESSDDPLNPNNMYMQKQNTPEPEPSPVKSNKRQPTRRGVLNMLFRRTADKRRAAAPQDRNSTDRPKGDDHASDSASYGRSNSGTGKKADLITKLLAREAELASDAGTDAGKAQVKGPPAPLLTAGKKGVVLEGYLTKRGGSGQKRSDYRNEPWERRYFTLSSSGNLFMYRNRQDYRDNPKSPILTRPLRLSDYYFQVFNINDPYSNTNSGPVEEDPQNPYRFQITLILRENVDNPASLANAALTLTAEGAVIQGAQGRTISTATNGTAGTNGTVSPMMSAQALRQAMYRDHWVLQCDTEEELILWVATVRELCPSCFREL